LVIEKSLAGTIGLFVKFSTLQEYGVDKVFFLENHNVDASQRNVVFLVRGENAKKARTVAGMLTFCLTLRSICAPFHAPSNPPGIIKIERTDTQISHFARSSPIPTSNYHSLPRHQHITSPTMTTCMNRNGSKCMLTFVTQLSSSTFERPADNNRANPASKERISDRPRLHSHLGTSKNASQQHYPGRAWRTRGS
jgi:hypothetical protein